MESFFKFDPYILQTARQAEEDCRAAFARLDEVAEYNACKVLSAFIRHRVSESHFAGSTGYGYGDRGREVLEEIFADITGAEDALFRHNFMSGTHALTVALFGVLRPGDTLVALAGKPYDTLCPVIGIGESGSGSLREFGVAYRQLDLLEDGMPDFEGVAQAVRGAKVVHIQRSRGYSLRESLHVAHIERLVKLTREANPQAIVLVDNCYGEFVEKTEPTQVGADLIVGSLIKNPGGGIARTGGYIAGRADLVELCACRLTAPGVGREIGCTLGETRNMFMGLFHAPTVVNAAMRTAVFSSALFERLGFAVYPRYDEARTDIIQAVRLGSEQALAAFCRGVQRGSPVDAFVTPEAWEMPGYDSRVIMAAGGFISGASIELSADGPMREPFAAWLQGGLTWPSGKLGAMLAAQSMLESGTLPN